VPTLNFVYFSKGRKNRGKVYDGFPSPKNSDGAEGYEPLTPSETGFLGD
jgi:hypothetical protein